jgi:hypothetical protein
MNRFTTAVPFLSNGRSVEADPGGEKDRTGAGEIPPCHPDGIHATP